MALEALTPRRITPAARAAGITPQEGAVAITGEAAVADTPEVAAAMVVEAVATGNNLKIE
jgi:hypothetical protein